MVGRVQGTTTGYPDGQVLTLLQHRTSQTRSTASALCELCEEKHAATSSCWMAFGVIESGSALALSDAGDIDAGYVYVYGWSSCLRNQVQGRAGRQRDPRARHGQQHAAANSHPQHGAAGRSKLAPLVRLVPERSRQAAAHSVTSELAEIDRDHWSVSCVTARIHVQSSPIHVRVVSAGLGVMHRACAPSQHL